MPPVIDAHHHFWRIARGDYGWMSPAMGLPLYRDHGPEDLGPLLEVAGVDRTVLVQAAETEAETAFLLDLADRTPFVAGVVGWLDLEDAHFAARLDLAMRRPRLKGLRPMLQDMEDDAWLLRPAVLASLRVMADRDLPLDLLVRPRHLPVVARMLDLVPDLRTVVDHIAKPAIAARSFDGWAADMARIASVPSVHCKLSGMITEADHGTWTPADLAPYVHHVLDHFGPGRSMYGSDWPVCLLAGTYGDTGDALRTALGPRVPQAGLEAIFGGTAARFYGLD